MVSARSSLPSVMEIAPNDGRMRSVSSIPEVPARLDVLLPEHCHSCEHPSTDTGPSSSRRRVLWFGSHRLWLPQLPHESFSPLPAFRRGGGSTPDIPGSSPV